LALTGGVASASRAIVPQATETSSQSQSIYRFWANERVKPEQMLYFHNFGLLHEFGEKEYDRANQIAGSPIAAMYWAFFMSACDVDRTSA
jgi:hypothetical protein